MKMMPTPGQMIGQKKKKKSGVKLPPKLALPQVGGLAAKMLSYGK